MTATPSSSASSSPPRRTNGWRTSTLVLALALIAVCVAWFMRERQVRLDHGQEIENYQIQLKSLQRELESRPLPEDAEDDSPRPPAPTTRPAGTSS